MAEEIIGAVGRRKEAVARVYIRPGNGETVVNGKELATYLGRGTLVMQVRQPLEVTESPARQEHCGWESPGRWSNMTSRFIKSSSHRVFSHVTRG